MGYLSAYTYFLNLSMQHSFFFRRIFYFSCSLLLFSCTNNTFDGKNGIKTVYFQNSKAVKQIVHYKDGKRDGELKEFYKNGNLKTRQQYVSDTLTDSSFSYYEDGTLMRIEYVRNHKKEGCWKIFNEEGKLFVEKNYKNDVFDGDFIKYSFRTLKPVEKLHYKNGELDGRQEYYHTNGKLKAVTYLISGTPCMGTEEWDQTGEKINNDFDITITRQNKSAQMGKLIFYVHLSDPRPSDEVLVVADTGSANCLTTLYKVLREQGEFLIERHIESDKSFVNTLNIAAIRKTAMGNSFIKTKTISLTAN